MVSLATIPPNEIARLASLESYGILDTPPDERFDLFTRLGTWIFNTPMCAIHFVGDDTTFFKSVIGFDTYRPVRCTSICAHAVGNDDPVMTIADLSLDERFQNHPLVVDKHLRFYAGAVLRSSSHHALGTICIGDVIPRNLSAEESEKLQALASGVVAVLELHSCGIRLLEAANRDVLTGLFNRRHFDMALQSSVEKARFGPPFALMFLDLDRFKSINDTLGHAAGDVVLCEIARRLQATARCSDVVARLAGDEFVLLVDDPVDEASIARLATRILAAIAAPFAYNGQSLSLSGSIGITICQQHASTPSDLLRHADTALYEAKRNGRNGFRLYQPAPHTTECNELAYAST